MYTTGRFNDLKTTNASFNVICAVRRNAYSEYVNRTVYRKLPPRQRRYRENDENIIYTRDRERNHMKICKYIRVIFNGSGRRVYVSRRARVINVRRSRVNDAVVEIMRILQQTEIAIKLTPP
jgi:hypothetical protein